MAARGFGAAWAGDAGDIGQDHASTCLAKLAAASEVERRGDATGGALKLAAVDPLGDRELALDLLRRSVEEEAKRNDRLLALWEQADDLADSGSAEAAGDLVVEALCRIDGIEREAVIVEGDGSPAASSLALVHRLVERRLRQVGPDLRGPHLRQSESADPLLLEEHHVGIVEDRLTI